MADLNQVRIQILDENTGAVIDSVDPKTSDGAVYLPDGATLRSWIAATEEAYSEFQMKLAAHLAKQHVAPEKVDSLFTAMSYDGNTGVFTITKHDGSTQTIDTLLEKVVVNFSLDENRTVYSEVADPEGNPSENGYYELSGTTYTASADNTVDVEKTYYTAATKTCLVLTSEDGTEQVLDVTKLIDVYTGSNGQKIVVTVGNDNVISANIVEGSISYNDLDTALKAKVDAEYTLPVATTSALGGVIVGDGINVDASGKISAANVTYNDGTGTTAVAMNIAEEENTAVIAVTGPADTVVETTVGTAVSPMTVTATITGSASANASATYQWYKRTVGTDVAFTAIQGATAATLPAANIDVTTAGTTMYYCTVGATGTGVVADPVTTKRVVVVVNAAA